MVVLCVSSAWDGCEGRVSEQLQPDTCPHPALPPPSSSLFHFTLPHYLFLPHPLLPIPPHLPPPPSPPPTHHTLSLLPLATAMKQFPFSPSSLYPKDALNLAALSRSVRLQGELCAHTGPLTSWMARHYCCYCLSTVDVSTK